MAFESFSIPTAVSPLLKNKPERVIILKTINLIKLKNLVRGDFESPHFYFSKVKNTNISKI